MRWLGMALVLGACGPETALLPELPTRSPMHVQTPAAPVTTSVERPAAASTATPTPRAQEVCTPQKPLPWLKRSSYAWRRDVPEAERQRRKRLHRKAIAYRTRHYGHVKGFGDPRDNRRLPREFVKEGSFRGVRVVMNARVLDALACVERDIEAECEAYDVQILSSFRLQNAFVNGEISNHAYGIALDINPNENPCCGCGGALSEWPRCRVKGDAFARAHVPRCWVTRFERYGFHWLGHDELEDTMHFEFLGDPEKIRGPQASRR